VHVALVGGLKAGAARRCRERKSDESLNRPHRLSLARSRKHIEPDISWTTELEVVTSGPCLLG
jgi:hypothetical protein